MKMSRCSEYFITYEIFIQFPCDVVNNVKRKSEIEIKCSELSYRIGYYSLHVTIPRIKYERETTQAIPLVLFKGCCRFHVIK